MFLFIFPAFAFINPVHAYETTEEYDIETCDAPEANEPGVYEFEALSVWNPSMPLPNRVLTTAERNAGLQDILIMAVFLNLNWKCSDLQILKEQRSERYRLG